MIIQVFIVVVEARFSSRDPKNKKNKHPKKLRDSTFNIYTWKKLTLCTQRVISAKRFG